MGSVSPKGIFITGVNFFLVSKISSFISGGSYLIQKDFNSLYDNHDFRNLVDKLPSSVVLGWTNEMFLDGPDYDGLHHIAATYGKDASDLVTVTILQFVDEESALDAKTELENEMASANATNVNVSCDDIYMTINANYGSSG